MNIEPVQDTIIGIDLGTSNCCISYIDEKGKIVIIREDPSSNHITIPSIIDVTSMDKGIISCGHEIDKNHIYHNTNIFHNFKRLIGHTVEDLTDPTNNTNIMEILSYKIESGENGIYCCSNTGKKYSISEVIFLLLRYLKGIIERHLSKMNIMGWKCIVTIPAYFNEIQRRITMDAIRICNLPLLKLLNEPTAASFAYLYHNNVLENATFNKKIMVIDYGAGTLDMTVLEITRDDDDMEGTLCEVLGTCGDNNFGGIDITKKVYKSLFNDDDYDMNLKMQIAEDIKIILSSQQNASYYCTELDKTFNYPYEEFIHQLKQFSDHIIQVIQRTLDISEITKDDIDDVVLVGGSFKNLYFRKQLSDYFEKDIRQPRIIVSNIEQLLYEDIAVSVGASVHGYYMTMSKGIVLVDRIPLSIGIETVGKQMTRIIERNTVIPTVKTKMFTPEEEEQSSIDINVFQGESMFCDKCQHIGMFTLSGLPVSRRSKPIIYVNITIDNNGILTIDAHDKRNVCNSSMEINSKSISLSEELINEIISQYEQNIFSEQLHKKIVKRYYELINIIDKISFQVNHNTCFELSNDIKEIMKNDISLIINKMNNKHVIKKYGINYKLIAKVIILNNIHIESKESFELSEEETDQFEKFLTELKYYLIDRYEIYLNLEYNMDSSLQVPKQESLKEDSESECSDNEDNVENEKFFDIIDRFTKNNDTILEIEYNDLLEYLSENYSSFGLSKEGEKLLLSKVESLKNSTKYEEATNELNEYCIYLSNNFTK